MKSFTKSVLTGIFLLMSIVVMHAQTQFYNRASGATALQTTTNWGTNPDGTGTAPTNFTAANQVFNIVNGTTVSNSAAWTVSGTNSKVVLGSAAKPAITFNASTAFTGTIDITAASSGSNTLSIATATIPTFGTINSGSTVAYARTGAQTVTGITYGNLTFPAASGVKTFGGNVTVTGLMTISGANSVLLNNVSTPKVHTVKDLTISAGELDGGDTNTAQVYTSTLNITGSLTKTGGVITNSSTLDYNSIIFNGGGTQGFSNSGTSEYTIWAVSNNSTLNVTSSFPLLGGTASITVDAGSTMDLATNQVVANGTGVDVNINGTLRTSNVNGLSGATTTAISSSNSPTIVLGTTSTVEYYSGVAQAVTGRSDYNHVIISGNSTKTAGAAMTLSGNLTINSGATFAAGGLTHNIKGDFTNNGAFTGGTSTINLNGTIGQTIGGSATTTFNNLIINKATGLTSLAANAGVNGTLTLTSGSLDIANSNLLLGAAAVSGTFSATRMIYASGTGELRRTYASAGSYVFPIGELTGTAEYSPVTVNVTSLGTANAYVGVKVVDAKHPNNGSATNYLTRYWTISQSGANTTATITGTYIAGDVTGTLATIFSGQLAGVFNASTNPWTRNSVLSGTTLTYTGATLAAGVTSAFTGIANTTVSISGGGTVCTNAPVTLTANASGGDGSYTYLWSNGLGTAATATPSTATPGTTNYSVTVTDANGLTATANTDVIVNPILAASVSIGASATTICAGTSVTFTATPTNGGAASYQWKVNGTNVGTNSTSYTTTTLANGDSVTCVMTSTTPCLTGLPATSNAIVMSVAPAATVNAGADQIACSSSPAVLLAGTFGGSASSATWSGGAGSFNPNNTTLNATYTPSAAEVSAGTVTLTLTTDDPVTICGAVSDSMVITINTAASANAGADQTICSSTASAAIAGTISGTGVTGSTWTTSGSGTFGSASSLSTTYTPSTADKNAGVVTLTLTTNDPAGPCGAAADTMVITINPAATVSAGANQIVCSGNTITLAGTIGGGASSATWSAPSGTFSNTSSLTSTYTPSITSGNVVLTLTTNDPAGPCGAVSSTMTVTVNVLPTSVTITPAAPTVCQNDIVLLTATGGLSTWVTDENFNGTPSFNAAGSNSGGGFIFTQKNSGDAAGLSGINTPDGSKHMMAVATSFGSATTTSTLTSPAVNTNGYTTLSFSYVHSYAKGENAGDYAKVEVSTNGSTWTQVQSHTSNRGSAGTMVSENINLDAYVNQPTLRVRFSYLANVSFATSWWAINGVSLSGTKSSVTWAPTAGLYTNAAATTPYGGGVTNTVYAKLTSAQTFTATSVSQAGCPVSNAVTISVNLLPTLSAVSQQATVCENTTATIQLSGLLANSTSNITYKINNGTPATVNGIVADASGAASFSVNLSLANNGQQLKITNIHRTDLAVACDLAPATNNTVTLQVNANVTYYADADSDGFGNAAISQVSCFGAPSGYVADNTDCNDNDNTKHTTYPFYTDADLDTYGTGGLVSVCAVDAGTPPSGYSLNNTDCNDADASLYQSATLFIDIDADGYDNGTAVVCYGASVPTGYAITSNGSDCNDNDNTKHATYPFYADNDNDGFGAGSGVNVCAVDAATPPAGYVLNNTDCNDADASVYQSATLFIDIDADGYDNGTAVVCYGASVPTGYALTSNGSDCNDNDNTKHATYPFYADNDNDGFGAGSAVNVCAVDAATPPAGYVLNNTDCNDADASVYQSATLFIDIDADGYDNGTAVVCYGASVPTGYALTSNGSDCDDNDNTKHATFGFYADNDADGYGAGILVSICTASPTVAPAGYSLNNTDCNDNSNTVHPNATEIGYNLIDDDCDGLTDEGFPPKVTVVQGAQCNNVLPAIDSQIIANLVAGAQGYRWRITAMSGPNTGLVQETNTLLRTVKLTQLPVYAFGTQYKIEVAVYYAGYLQPFTPSTCTITSPSPTTALAGCGQTLTVMSQPIYANIVPFAAGYRFRITDPVNPSNTQVLERPLREFRMNLITDFAVQFGKVYNVEVSVKNTDGSWLPYGNVCNVTTPIFPTSSLQDSQCDDYLVPNYSSQIYAISNPTAIAYVFQISGVGLATPIEVTKPLRAFTLNDFAGQLLPATTYNVRVRLIFNMADPAGPFGKTCTIVTPGVSRPATTQVLFDAQAYPNPFAETVNIKVTSASDSGIGIKVYDMTGRLLENTTFKASTDIAPIGSGYPAGVYNIIVTQGSESKTLRVIKR